MNRCRYGPLRRFIGGDPFSVKYPLPFLTLAPPIHTAKMGRHGLDRISCETGWAMAGVGVVYVWLIFLLAKNVHVFIENIVEGIRAMGFFSTSFTQRDRLQL